MLLNSLSMGGNASTCYGWTLTVDDVAANKAGFGAHPEIINAIQIAPGEYIVGWVLAGGAPFSCGTEVLTYDGSTLTWTGHTRALEGTQVVDKPVGLGKITNRMAMATTRDFDNSHSPNHELLYSLLSYDGSTLTKVSSSEWHRYAWNGSNCMTHDGLNFSCAEITSSASVWMSIFKNGVGWGTGGGSTAAGNATSPAATCWMQAIDGDEDRLIFIARGAAAPLCYPVKTFYGANAWSVGSSTSITGVASPYGAISIVRMSDTEAIAIFNETGITAVYLTYDAGAHTVTQVDSVAMDLEDNGNPTLVSIERFDGCNACVYAGLDSSNYPQFQLVTVDEGQLRVNSPVALSAQACTLGAYGKIGERALLRYDDHDLIYVAILNSTTIRAGTIRT